MGSFEDLNLYKKCRSFRIDISVLLKCFPIEEKYLLVDQMKRASRSITANIAEGHGKFHYLDNIRHCRHARGSINEMLDHLNCALDEKYITTEELRKFKNQIDECLKLLNGYISFLKKGALVNKS